VAATGPHCQCLVFRVHCCGAAWLIFAFPQNLLFPARIFFL
jgi:hypothetical protein